MEDLEEQLAARERERDAAAANKAEIAAAVEALKAERGELERQREALYQKQSFSTKFGSKVCFSSGPCCVGAAPVAYILL